jgi:hypothetical protein
MVLLLLAVVLLRAAPTPFRCAFCLLIECTCKEKAPCTLSLSAAVELVLTLARNRLDAPCAGLSCVGLFQRPCYATRFPPASTRFVELLPFRMLCMPFTERLALVHSAAFKSNNRVRCVAEIKDRVGLQPRSKHVICHTSLI